jgi:hypothetical protein
MRHAARALTVVACVSLSVVVAGTQTQSPPPAVPTLDLTVRIQPEARRLDISGQLTIPPAAAPMQETQLRLDTRMTSPQISVISPAQAAGAAIVTRSGNRVTARLPALVPSGTPLVLGFSTAVETGLTRSFYAGEDGAYISGESFTWYPLPAGSRRAVGTVRFSAPAGFTVASTGRQRHGTPPGTFEFDVADPTTFSFAAARHTVHRTEGRPAIALHLLTPRPRIAERLQTIRRIVTALEAEFGPYPHPDLEIVEMPDLPAGGALAGVSLEGFVVSGRSQLDSMNLPFFAHEIAHQWWADSVFGVGPGRALLAESMAQYGALRVVERVHGAAAAAAFRWQGYPGYGIFDSGRGYIVYAAETSDVPLTAAALPTYLPYSKGFLVHDHLARTAGRERFRAFLTGFARRHRFSDVTWRTFLEELKLDTGFDPTSFAEQWYDRAGVPEWDLTWAYRDGRVRGVVTQKEPTYDAEVTVLMEGDRRAGRATRQRVHISGPRTELSWSVPFTVTSVTLDPDYEVPHVTRERRADADILMPIGKAIALMQSGGGADFLTAIDTVYAALPDRAAPRHRFMLDAVLYYEAFKVNDYARARTRLERALALPAPLPALLPEMYYARAVMARAAGDERLVKESVTRALAADGALVAPSGWGTAAEELLNRNSGSPIPDP